MAIKRKRKRRLRIRKLGNGGGGPGTQGYERTKGRQTASVTGANMGRASGGVVPPKKKTQRRSTVIKSNKTTGRSKGGALKQALKQGYERTKGRQTASVTGANKGPASGGVVPKRKRRRPKRK